MWKLPNIEWNTLTEHLGWCLQQTHDAVLTNTQTVSEHAATCGRWRCLTCRCQKAAKGSPTFIGDLWPSVLFDNILSLSVLTHWNTGLYQRTSLHFPYFTSIPNFLWVVFMHHYILQNVDWKCKHCKMSTINDTKGKCSWVGSLGWQRGSAVALGNHWSDIQRYSSLSEPHIDAADCVQILPVTP